MVVSTSFGATICYQRILQIINLLVDSKLISLVSYAEMVSLYNTYGIFIGYIYQYLSTGVI